MEKDNSSDLRKLEERLDYKENLARLKSPKKSTPLRYYLAAAAVIGGSIYGLVKLVQAITK